VGLDVWGERVAANADNLVEPVGRNLLIGAQGVPAVLMTLLLAAALVYTWLDRRSMLDWYAMGSVAVLLTLYLFADRFVLPVLPLLISALLHAAHRLGRALRRGASDRQTPDQGASMQWAPVAAMSVLLLAVGLTALPGALAYPDNREANRSMDEQVAEWLSVSSSTLYHCSSNGGGPPKLKIGGALRYKRCCVRAWIDDQRSDSGE
jgi:predicted DNA-binding transcriptional regulator AlpA